MVHNKNVIQMHWVFYPKGIATSQCLILWLTILEDKIFLGCCESLKNMYP